MRFYTFFAFLGTTKAHIMDSLFEVPRGWTHVGCPKPMTRLTLRIAMAQPNQLLFEQKLYEISNPSHPRYGMYLKRDELKAVLRPSIEATEAVMSWLRRAGVAPDSIHDDGEWINFRTSVHRAEKLLDTKFDIYRSTEGADSIRTLAYSLPRDLHQYVDMIQPTTRFSQLKPVVNQALDMQRGRDADVPLTFPSFCQNTSTPACIKKIYHIDPSVINDTKKAGFMAFNNFLGGYPQYKDLSIFESKFAPYANGKSFNWTSINGGLLVQNSTQQPTEANLDAQYLLAIGYPMAMLAYSTGGRGPLIQDLDQPSQATNGNEPYLDWLNYILSLPDNKLPHTISTSYGEDEQSSPHKYRTTVCNMFGQLGSRGVSVLFGSGDVGVGSACQSNNGKNTTEFTPIFPASCPYVTSVGGTSGFNPEYAVPFSSGGFSNTWARPWYQEKAVSTYLKKLGNKWEGLYNKTGRGFPDVAARAENFQVIIQSQIFSVGRTSAATPTFSGVIALLNGARIEAGLHPLGFLNPWIYSEGYKGLNDIVHGGSKGCTGHDIYSNLSTPYVPYASWNATVGWDPVTGYGTPNFTKLVQIVLPINDPISTRTYW